MIWSAVAIPIYRETPLWIVWSSAFMRFTAMSPKTELGTKAPSPLRSAGTSPE